MALLDSPDIRKIEARYVSLFGRTLIKGMKGVPASAYKSKVKMQFGTATFRVQLDQIINDFYKTAIGYIDNEIDKQFSGQGIRYVRRRPGRSPITAASEPLPLTVELVKQSTELSEVAVSSIIEMMKEDGIYELHPNTLAKRLTEFFDGEKHRAVRFSRTVSADIANNSTLHRYRQRKIGRWQFHAKLDDRTTDQCRLLHGTIFETDDPSSDQYRPPLHHHCRSAMHPVPLSMPVDESLLFKNRDFSDAVDQNHRHVPTDFEPDISKALGEIDKFKQKYAINKFILDADIERRLLKLGVGMGTPVIDQGFFGVPEKPRFKRGFEVRAEIPKIRDELENQITEATREIEELNQARYALRGKYDKLDNEWRVRLANYDLDFDTPEYKSYMERLEKIKIELDGAENLFADALRKRTKLYQDSGNVIKNAIRINDGERRTIYNFNDFKDRAEYEKLMKSLGINQENSPFDGMEKAEEFINSVASSEVRDRLGNIKMVAEDGRAYTRNDGSKKIYIDGYYRPHVIIHESGHQIEFSDPRIKTAANEFLGRRTAGEEARPLSELTGDPRYGSSEIAKKDKFMSPYVGKIYDDKDTEVISMGIQYLYEDPEKLMKEDPELFDLVIDVLRGNLDAGDSD